MYNKKDSSLFLQAQQIKCRFTLLVCCRFVIYSDIIVTKKEIIIIINIVKIYIIIIHKSRIRLIFLLLQSQKQAAIHLLKFYQQCRVLLWFAVSTPIENKNLNGFNISI